MDIAEAVLSVINASAPKWRMSRGRRRKAMTVIELPAHTSMDLRCGCSPWLIAPSNGAITGFEAVVDDDHAGRLATPIVRIYRKDGVVRHTRCGKEVARINI